MPAHSPIEITFTADRAAVELVKHRYELTKDPLYLVNKARAYTKIKGTGKRAYGGPEWERLKAFQAAVAMACNQALTERAREIPIWVRSARYEVEIIFSIGDRLIQVYPAGNRAPHTRRTLAHRRCRSIGVDKAAQAVLDALQHVLWLDDELVEDLHLRKVPREGEIGDRITITAKVVESP